MRVLWLISFLTVFYSVASKNNVKSLTESMGQEVIEIGAPIKDLPPGLEEEPSAENDDDDKYSSNTIQPATKKEAKRTTTMPEPRRKISKDIDKIDGVSQEDEEARIEKELAEIYKDTADYKADSAESSKETSLVTASATTVEDVDKPIERQRSSFKFQPDISNNADVERFRTSIDEISCDNRVTQKLSDDTEYPNAASNPISDLTYLCLTILIAFY